MTILKLCWSLGGTLAEFKDKAEESHVATFLNVDNAFWIGLNDLSQEGIKQMIFHISILEFFSCTGVFKWAETHQETDYTNWQEGEPNSHSGDEDCVVTHSVDGESFGWKDQDCDYALAHALCNADYKF